MSQNDRKLVETVARLERTVADLQDRVGFLEILLDISIRTTDASLRGHADFVLTMLDGCAELGPANEALARRYAAHIRHLKDPDFGDA